MLCCFYCQLHPEIIPESMCPDSLNIHKPLYAYTKPFRICSIIITGKRESEMQVISLLPSWKHYFSHWTEPQTTSVGLEEHRHGQNEKIMCENLAVTPVPPSPVKLECHSGKTQENSKASTHTWRWLCPTDTGALPCRQHTGRWTRAQFKAHSAKATGVCW